MNTKHNHFTPRLILGLGVLAIGVLFLLGNLDIIEPREYLRLWPAIIALIGLTYLIQSQNASGRVWGIILMFIGTAMLLDKLYFINFSLWSYWPLILVFVGGMMIWKSMQFRKDINMMDKDKADANSFIKATAILGGFRRTCNSKDFKGGELTTIMGALEIDLREASIKGEAILDVFALMGGVEMRVPDDWQVIVEGFPVLGGYEDKTRPPKETNQRLIIRGNVVMGGMEIKN